MNEYQIEMIEHLMDLCEMYYTETVKLEDGDTALMIPSSQPEGEFISEVFIVLNQVLEEEGL
jgi:hypothetical protein